MVNIKKIMKNRGFYLKENKGQKLDLYINIEQFKQFLDDNADGLEWLKFTIYKNDNINSGFTHNIKLNKTTKET